MDVCEFLPAATPAEKCGAGRSERCRGGPEWQVLLGWVGRPGGGREPVYFDPLSCRFAAGHLGWSYYEIDATDPRIDQVGRPRWAALVERAPGGRISPATAPGHWRDFVGYDRSAPEGAQEVWCGPNGHWVGDDPDRSPDWARFEPARLPPAVCSA